MKIKYPIGGFAPGHYMCKCATCGEEYTGDKYSKQCEPCAINAVNESNLKALEELYKLKTALEKIKATILLMKYLVDKLDYNKVKP